MTILAIGQAHAQRPLVTPPIQRETSDQLSPALGVLDLIHPFDLERSGQCDRQPERLHGSTRDSARQSRGGLRRCLGLAFPNPPQGDGVCC